PGDRDVDRRHGAGQVPHERHRELGAEPQQVSRDAQLLHLARLAGAPSEHPLPRQGRQGALCPHPQQYGARIPENPCAFAGESSDRGWTRPLARGAPGVDGRQRIPLKYEFKGDDCPPTHGKHLREIGWTIARVWHGFGPMGAMGPKDGPPVLVIPGFLATDRTTMALRKALARAGYRVQGWGLGWNLGVKADTIDRLEACIDKMGTTEPVLVVGWSLS